MTDFEDILARDGQLIYRIRGKSMEPMLRQDRDLVIIGVPGSRLRKNDVALYKRRSGYVLHRVIAVKEGCYLIRGDNTYFLERVPERCVIGVLTAFRRKGREHAVTEMGYLLYVRFWNAVYPLRLALFRCRGFAVRAAVRLGAAPFLRRLLKRTRRESGR